MCGFPYFFVLVFFFVSFSVTVAALADDRASRGEGVPGQGVVQQRLLSRDWRGLFFFLLFSMLFFIRGLLFTCPLALGSVWAW